MGDDEKEGYLMALEQLEARKQLRMFKAFDYSQMKPDAKSKAWKELSKAAYPNYKPKTVRMDEIDKFIGGQ